MADKSKKKVTISFSRDPKEIGKTVDVDAATAQAWVAEGRAAYAKGETPPKTKQAGGGKVEATPVDATDPSGQQTGPRK